MNGRTAAEFGCRPLACFTIAFSLGIAAAWLLLPAAWVAAGGGLLCAALALAFRRLAPALILAGGLLTGAAAFLATEGVPSDIWPLDRTVQTFTGVVADEPLPRDTGVVFPLRLESLRTPSGRTAVRGKLRAYAPSNAGVRWGDRVECRGRVVAFSLGTNPGEVPLRLRYGAQGVRGLLLLGSHARIRRLGHEEPPLSARALAAARARVRRILRDSMPGPYGPLLADLLGSILFGLRTMPVPPAIVDSFRRCGTVHILVVSGTQISLLFTLVWLPGAAGLLIQRRRAGGPWLADRGRPPEPGPASLAVVLLLMAAYSLFAGGGNPVWRATIMGCLVALAIALRHIPSIAEQHPLETDGYTLLAAAALVILVQRPAALLDPGFQLSFAAVLGLLYVSPRVAAALSFLPGWLKWTISLAVGAQLATMPIVAWHFGDVSMMGFAGNLMAVPLAAILLVLGLTACALGLLWMPLAVVVNYPSALILWWLVRGTAVLSAMPGASIRYRPNASWQVLAYYAILVGLTWTAGRVAAARYGQALPAAEAA